MKDLKGIVVVKKEDLIDYLMTTKAEAWTEKGWNELFDELMSSMFLVE